jgi:alkylation response protein AidB-like acyl-CoA dehydrogenase
MPDEVGAKQAPDLVDTAAEQLLGDLGPAGFPNRPKRNAQAWPLNGNIKMTIILDRVREVLPVIRARRDEIERARRMPRDLIDRLRSTGVFGLTVPRDMGGEQARPTDTMRVIETAATADGSAGWCVMIGAGNNIAAGYMNERGAREVFHDPTAPTAGIAAPAGAAVPVDGGVRVSGRWPFASGITHCEWVWAGCMIMENGKPRMTSTGPEIVHLCMPVRELEIHDTWHVSGLCGTGSTDFSAADVFVPEHRIFALLDPAGHRPEPLYQMPPLATFVFQLVSVSLGIARAALDELTELAQTKVPSLYNTVLADRPMAQIEIARAEAALGAARSFLFDTVGDMWETVSAGHAPTMRQLALGRIATIQVAETAATVTRTINTLGGGSSIYLSSSLQRHARDAEAITHHFTVAQHTWEEAGRVLLGRQPAVPMF